MTRKVLCMRTFLRAAALLYLGACLQPFAAAQEPLQVGERYPLSVDSSQAVNDLPAQETTNGLRWVLTHPGATYIAIHFEEFDLAIGDEVIISDAVGGQAYHMTGLGKMNLGTFWAQHVTGDTAVLDLITSNQQPHEGFVIDEYAAGFAEIGGTASICGVDDQENAICRYPSVEYDRGRAVATLLIDGAEVCTGWLASASNHLITNNHCFDDPAQQVANTDYTFGYEAATCGEADPPRSGTTFSGATFIKGNADLDYVLVQIADGDPQAEFGHLEIDDRPAIIGEQIYVVSHPGGRAKKFAYNSTGDIGGVGRVLAISEYPVFHIGYNNDTRGGSSGAPVIAVSSQKVIALHFAGGFNFTSPCDPFNGGVPIDRICTDIGGNFCNSCTVTNELVGSTCRDGIDNDCDGYTDCEDVADCAADPACRCYSIVNGPLVCVDWAGPIAPELNRDFTVDAHPDPENPNGNPNVTFVTGNHGWKVWAQVDVENDTPASLGHIKIDPDAGSTANFSVTVAHGALPGANYVASMPLVKTGWTGRSNVAGGSITGDLAGDLILQDTAGLNEGAIFIVNGDVYGDITIPTVNTLEVKGSVSANSTITVGGFAGGHKRVKLNTNFGTFAGELALPNGVPDGAWIDIHGSFRGLVDFDGQPLAGKLNLFGGSSEESTINIGQLAPTGFISMAGFPYEGDVTLTSIESSGQIEINSLSMNGTINVLEDWKGLLTGVGYFGPDGLISIGGNMTGSLFFNPPFPGITSGNIVIEQNYEGFVSIDGNMTGDVYSGRMNGSLTVSAGMSGDIIVAQDSNGYINIGANITGEVDIGGVLNGGLSATNLSANAPLPSNISIGCGIGTSGTISGEVPTCPAGNILSSLAWPPHGTKDARQPYPMGPEGTPVLLSARQGIGSPNPDAREEDKIRMTLDNSGLRAISHDCWALCETGVEFVESGTPPLSDNKISCVAESTVGGSEYEIRLERPISAGHWTTLRYAPGTTRVIYASLPGNISGDTRTNSIDLIRRIDCMNGQTSQCGSTVWTQDLDHSGEFAVGLDYGITFVDLWNGAGNFLPWQQTQLPANTCIGGSGGGGGVGICPSAPCGGEDPGPMSMATGGFGEWFEESSLESESSEFVEDENAIFAEWVIGFLAGANPQDEQAVQILQESVDLIVQWCVANLSADEKSALAGGLSDPGISFASSVGQNAAETVVANITP